MKMTTIARSLLLALPLVAVAAPAQDGNAPYKVVDGYKVDAFTMKGFRAWRAAACDRCHGANQEGMVGPSLLNSLIDLLNKKSIALNTGMEMKTYRQQLLSCIRVFDFGDQSIA